MGNSRGTDDKKLEDGAAAAAREELTGKRRTFHPPLGVQPKGNSPNPLAKKFSFLLYENMRNENTTSCLLSRNQLSKPTGAIPAMALRPT